MLYTSDFANCKCRNASLSLYGIYGDSDVRVSHSVTMPANQLEGHHTLAYGEGAASEGELDCPSCWAGRLQIFTIPPDRVS